MMGQTLAHRLKREFYFGLVVENDRDPRFTRLDVPYVLWADIQEMIRKFNG